MAAGHCPGCAAVGCPGCLPELDPPRYCTRCGGWLRVIVHTAGWESTCRRCGAEGRA
ncbi:MAG: hypothetical protein P6D49_06975 [Acidimicrobiales bacterium]|nr:hypothetical protein [Acidimicrobiales bacterium]